jgi:hypothetical protein
MYQGFIHRDEPKINAYHRNDDHHNEHHNKPHSSEHQNNHHFANKSSKN